VSVTEICLIVIALAALTVAAVAAFIGARIVPLIRRFEELGEAATRTTQRLDGLVEEVHVMARDARQVQSRVGSAASEILNILEPSLHTVSAVVGGLRTGLAAFLGLRKGTP
jgi:hypothetical protein